MSRRWEALGAKAAFSRIKGEVGQSGSRLRIWFTTVQDPCCQVLPRCVRSVQGEAPTVWCDTAGRTDARFNL